jgi:hypothetical protein
MYVLDVFQNHLRIHYVQGSKLLDPKKISTTINMPTLKTPTDIQVFNGRAQFYHYFIKDFAFIMASITKLF